MANPAGPFSRWERAIAGRYLRARRKEAGVAFAAILAFVGITVAIFGMITVMSVMNGFRAQLVGTMLNFNGHIYVGGPILASPQRDRAVARIRAVPNVVQAMPLVEAQGMVVGKGQIAGAIVRGVSPADLKATSIIANNIKQGSLAGFGEGEYGGELILVGARLAQALSVRPGDSITLISPAGAATVMGSTPTQKDYIVGGVFEVGNSLYDQGYIYMPLEQAQEFFGRGTSVDVIEVKVAEADAAPAMKADVARAGGPEAFVTDWTQKDQAFYTALKVERNVMRLILMVIVSISGLLITVSLLMLVMTKGRDIAVLRTMGASRGAILRIFLMDGIAIGMAGAISGVFLGTMFCLNIEAIQKAVEAVTQTQVFNADVYFLSRIPAQVDWAEVGGIVVFTFLISLLATVVPAFWGSRLDPVAALRNE